MAQHYSDPKRENDMYALPDVETFEVTLGTPQDECPMCQENEEHPEEKHNEEHCGWYWWSCFPGCLPDGEAQGPFETEEEALEDAREGNE
jgi:hypothetical protein